MIYQFENEEIKMCVNCKLCDINFDWCNMQSCLIDKYKTPQENDCPLVAISEKETTSCEWCERELSFEVVWHSFGSSFVDKAMFCPNCGRRLED